MLTSDRREAEASELLSAHLAAARGLPDVEASAWLVHALATANQYLGNYDEADRLFAEAVLATQTHGWRRLEHFVLHHWGRCLAEQGRIAQARTRFEQSLAIREELGALQESSRRALAALARLDA